MSPRNTVTVQIVTDVLTSPSPTDAWPSSAAFDWIAEALKEESERKDAIKKGGAIFAFTLKNDQGETADWYVDLKDTGKVGKGSAPEGKKANGRSQSFRLHTREGLGISRRGGCMED